MLYLKYCFPEIHIYLLFNQDFFLSGGQLNFVSFNLQGKVTLKMYELHFSS